MEPLANQSVLAVQPENQIRAFHRLRLSLWMKVRCLVQIYHSWRGF